MRLNTVTVLDQAAIDEIRKAVVCWFHCEAGAPAIHPASPMSELGEDYAEHLEAFIYASDLPKEGKYSFPNPLIGLQPYTRHDHGIPSFYFDGGDKLKEVIEIEITKEHYILIGHLSLDDRTTPDRPRFEPKRVYNGHRDAARGAYEAINGEPEDGRIELTDAEWKRYERLHDETAAVLQVILRESVVEPGIYNDNLFFGFKKIAAIDDYEAGKELCRSKGLPYSRKHYLEMATSDPKN